MAFIFLVNSMKYISLKHLSPQYFITYFVLQQKKVFELNVNITDTELVVVENSADKDTNAVIVKTTAVLSFCPSKLECPMKCSLQARHNPLYFMQIFVRANYNIF